MSVKADLHSLTKARFKHVRAGTDVRWLTFEDKDGNSISVFIRSIDDLELMLNAIQEGVKSFDPNLPRVVLG